MELSIENNGDLVMRKDFKEVCRVAHDLTDLDLQHDEQLSEFVARHGGIDATLDYLNSCKL